MYLIPFIFAFSLWVLNHSLSCWVYGLKPNEMYIECFFRCLYEEFVFGFDRKYRTNLVRTMMHNTKSEMFLHYSKAEIIIKNKYDEVAAQLFPGFWNFSYNHIALPVYGYFICLFTLRFLSFL